MDAKVCQNSEKKEIFVHLVTFYTTYSGELAVARLFFFYHFCCLSLHVEKSFLADLGVPVFKNVSWAPTVCHIQETLTTLIFHKFCFTKTDRSVGS